MQTTLLGLAIAVILAIVAALTAPLYIDWNAHRALFEIHLSRIAGAPVVIRGPIDATVLPIPRFVFHGVEVGRGDGRLRIAEARGSLAVGALLRGEIRAEDIVLDGPAIALELDAAGRLVGFAAGAADLLPPLAVEQAEVRNGVVVLRDRRAARTTTIEAIDVRGELRSQAGPVKLEGAATIAGVRTQLRLITGRFDDDEGMRLRLLLEPVDGPAIEIDGALSAADGRPQFDGQMVATRAANDAGRPRVRVTGKVLGSAESVRFDKFALSVGPEDRTLDLDGSARLDLGVRPRFDAVLAARQLDLDRTAGSEPGVSAGPPLGVLAKLLGGFASSVPVPLPVRLGLSVDTLLVGGDAVRDLRLDLAGASARWSLEHFEARLPGRAALRFTGAADPRGGAEGQATFEAPDPPAVMRWVEGGGARGVRAMPLKAAAHVVFDAGRIVLDDLNVEGSGAKVSGRVEWRRSAPARGVLVADLSGAALDLDAVQDFVRTARLASPGLLDGAVHLTLSFDELRYGGLPARAVKARLGYEAGVVTVEQASVGSYGGLSGKAEGRLDTRRDHLAGKLALDLSAQDSAGLLALAGAAELPPALARRLAEVAVPANLRIELAAEQDGQRLSLAVRGRTAAGQLDIIGVLPVETPRAASLQLSLDGDAASLLALAGLAETRAAGRGQLRLTYAGSRNGAFEARLALPTLQVRADGRFTQREGVVEPDLAVTLERADLAELFPGLGAAALPLAGKLRLTRKDGALQVDTIDVRLADRRVRGGLAFGEGVPVRITGTLEAERIELPALVAALIGRSAPAPGWSGAPFGRPGVTAVPLDVAFSTPALVLAESATIGGAQFALRVAPPRSEFNLSAGTLAGGSVHGRLVLVRNAADVAGELHMTLAGADLAALLPRSAGEERLTGRVGLAVDVAGTGRSPAELIATLAGQGALRLEQTKWPALSPNVFADLASLAREGTPDEPRVRAAATAALAKAPLIVPAIETTLVVVGGQVRTGLIRTDAGAIAARGSLTADLPRETLRGEVALAPRSEVLPGSPELLVRWSGALRQPERTIDVTALVTSLALAAVERETKRLDERTLRRAMPLPVEAAPTVLPEPPATAAVPIPAPTKPNPPVPKPPMAPPARPTPDATAPDPAWLDRVQRALDGAARSGPRQESRTPPLPAPPLAAPRDIGPAPGAR